MAGWSIRRKLMLLVMIPLVALLVGGGVLVTQFALEYRQARTAKSYAEAILPALLAGEALSNEFGSTDPDPARLRQARAATDVQLTALDRQLDELVKGDPDASQLPVAAEQVQNALEKVPNARGLVNRLVASGTINQPTAPSRSPRPPSCRCGRSAT